MRTSTFERSDAAICGIPGTLSDELLVSAAKAGDHLAFTELCGRHSKKLLSVIYRITRNSHDAEDVLQESLLKAFTHVDSFEGRSSFSSWLTRIAINSALMVLRKRRGIVISINTGSDDSQTCQAWEPRDPKQSPEALFARRETEALVKYSLLRLPSKFRQVMVLQYTQGYSASEIARTLDISLAATKSRMSRAKAAMRASLIQ